MTHAIELAKANWPLISAIAVAVISEVLPYVKSTEANGVLQLILSIFKKPAPAIAQPEVKP